MDFKIVTEAKMEELEDTLRAVSLAIDVNSEEHNIFNSKIKSLESKINALEKEHSRLDTALENSQMYSRRNNLIFHGLKEARDEETDNAIIKFLKSEMNIDLHTNDLDRSHRLGPKTNTKRRPRPIIVKFTRHNVKSQIYAQKKRLKGKPYLITESLTPERLKIYHDAREKYGPKNVWTLDGKVKAKADGQVHVLV